MKFNSLKILILVVICNIAAAFGYCLLFTTVKDQTASASSLNSTIELGQQKNSHLNSLRSVVKDTEQGRKVIEGLLLPNDSEVAFIENVEDLAKKSGLTQKTNKVSSGAADPKRILQLEEEVKGSWNNVMYFLAELEGLPYNIRIPRVSLSKTGEKNIWTALVSINVTESSK